MTTYHPQSDRQMEHANQEVEKYLKLFCDKHQDNWVRHLSTAEFVFNSHVSSATGYSPFEVLYRYHPDFTIPPGHQSTIPALDQCLKQLAETHKEAEAAMCLSNIRKSHPGSYDF